MLIALAVVLGGFSLYLNKDRFAKDNIHIYHRSRPGRAALFRRKHADPSATINPIVFGFDRKLKLKSLKVIPMSAIETNKYPHPIWHLISESNSVAIKDFSYGTTIPGMHPAVEGAIPDPLEPNVAYRLEIESGPLKADHDFTPTPLAR